MKNEGDIMDSLNEYRIIMITVEEAVKILREHGWKGDEGHLRAGIDAGVYDFAVSFEKKRRVYEIYLNKLLKWIEERSMNVEKELTA